MRPSVRNLSEFVSLAIFSGTVGALWLTVCYSSATFFCSTDPLPSAAAVTAATFGNGLFVYLSLLLWQAPFTLTVRLATTRHDAKRVHGVNGAILGSAAAFFFYFVGRNLSEGDWISQQNFSLFIAPVSALLGAIVFFAVGVAVSYALLETCNGRPVARVCVGVAALLSFLCVVADRMILPKQYPSFHLLLNGTAIFFSSVGAVFLFRHFSANLSHRRMKILFVCALTTFAAVFVVYRSSEAQKRIVPVDFSAVAAKAFSFCNAPGPPISLDLVLSRVEMSGPKASARPRGQIQIPKEWNIILIVVDALRADALPPNRRPKQNFARKKDTPFLDHWLENTFRFARNYAPGSATAASLPSIFQSSEGDLSLKSGAWLQDRMKEQGRAPIAVVNDLFTSKKSSKLDRIIRRFDFTDSYDRKSMDSQTDKMLAAIDKAGKTPFFAWFHFYNMHDPLYAGDSSRIASQSGYSKKYRIALKWLDGRIRKLFEGLETRGLLENSVVVLTADHGEALYDHGYRTHGNSIFDEEVKVPLAFRIPGRNGSVIRALTGSIDLMPTLLDLMGAPADSRHHGTSLVPLMMNPHAPHTDRYYLRNKKGTLTGMVERTHKIAYDKTNRVFFHYDLRTDPKERVNIFDPHNPMDQTTAVAFALKNPDIYKEQLKDRRTQERLFQKLLEVNDTTPKETADFLLRLGVMDGSPKLRQILDTLHKKCDNPQLQARIADTRRTLDNAKR